MSKIIDDLSLSLDPELFPVNSDEGEGLDPLIVWRKRIDANLVARNASEERHEEVRMKFRALGSWAAHDCQYDPQKQRQRKNVEFCLRTHFGRETKS